MLSETAHVDFEAAGAQFGTARSEFRTAPVEFGKPTHPAADGCLMLALVGPSLLGSLLFLGIRQRGTREVGGFMVFRC